MADNRESAQDIEDRILKNSPMRWDGRIGIILLILFSSGILFGWFWDVILWFFSLFT